MVHITTNTALTFHHAILFFTANSSLPTNVNELQTAAAVGIGVSHGVVIQVASVLVVVVIAF